VSPSSGQRLLALFAPFGSTFGEISWNLFFCPGITLSALFTVENITYVFNLLRPVGPLGLANLANLFLIPNLSINMLASRVSPPVADVCYHYSFLLAGLIFVSLICNLGATQKLSAWFSTEVQRFRPALLSVIFPLLLIAFKDVVVFGPIHSIMDSRRR